MDFTDFFKQFYLILSLQIDQRRGMEPHTNFEKGIDYGPR